MQDSVHRGFMDRLNEVDDVARPASQRVLRFAVPSKLKPVVV